jgi:phosphohistidine phosphatase
VPAPRLVLVRHAEAGLAPLDRDRPLTPRGEREAEAVGAWLAALGTAPDRVVVSPALRARQTWERARTALDRAPAAELDERVSENTVDGLLELVRESDQVVATLVVVGHNPAIGQLVHDLDDGDGNATARQEVGRRFPPGAVAVLDVATGFADLGPGGATLVDVRFPSS